MAATYRRDHQTCLLNKDTLKACNLATASLTTKVYTHCMLFQRAVLFGQRFS